MVKFLVIHKKDYSAVDGPKFTYFCEPATICMDEETLKKHLLAIINGSTQWVLIQRVED
jgi:hypothetical protein